MPTTCDVRAVSSRAGQRVRQATIDLAERNGVREFEPCRRHFIQRLLLGDWIDDLVDTGFDNINDKSARWTLPFIVGVHYRF